MILGQNVLTAKVSYDYANRFGTYKVKGQRSGSGSSWDATKTQISGESTDSVFGSRTRTKIIVLDGSGTSKIAQDTASWEAQVRAGRSGKLTVKSPSWFQSDGNLWDVGYLVYCNIPELKIQEQLLINSVTYSQDNSGTFCELSLVNKDTYLRGPSKITKIPKKSKKKGFGYGW